MNQEDSWDRLASIAPSELRGAALEIHWATQIVAAAGQSFAEPKEDDSHRAMSWDRDLQAFLGAPLAGTYPFRVSVRPSDLTLQLVDRSGQALGSLPLSGQTLDEGRSWLSIGLATYMGGDPPALERPEYELPLHPVGTGSPFAKGLLRERRTVAALYDAAAALLTEFVERLENASTVSCWPHHFDIATLLTLKRSEGITKTVGVGMAPMGGGYDAWYWYVTPWPYPDRGSLPALGATGRWHTEGWVGAVLEGEQVTAASAGTRRTLVRGFIDSAVAAATEALSA